MADDNNALRLVIDETIEQNQSIRVLKSDVAELKSDVAELKTDVAGLKSDVAELKTDVAGLKTDVAGLKEGQQRLEEGQRRLDDGQTYLGLTMEDLKKNLNLLIDAVIPAKARAAQIDQVVDTSDRQEARLGALESAFRHHISGHAAPR